jgi:hypothetical protein
MVDRDRNREAQRRWRARHARQRALAQDLSKIVLRRSWPDDAGIAELAGLLRSALNREGLRSLRRALREETHAEGVARSAKFWAENERQWREQWLAAHPGRTAKQYRESLKDQDGAVWAWRRAQGQASTEKEKQAWLADHPEQEWPEHECALSDAEGIALSRWRKRRARKLGFPL